MVEKLGQRVPTYPVSRPRQSGAVMPSTYICPVCGSRAHAGDDALGNPSACAECGQTFLPLETTRETRQDAPPLPVGLLPSPPPEHLPEPATSDSDLDSGELAPAADQPSREKKTIVLGDFRLIKKIGEGAMGIVYKGRQLSLERDVAVKVLFKHVAKRPKAVERFYREARIMKRLTHPNIVHGIEVDCDQGWHYFAMEYVDGHNLQKWLTRLGRLSIGDALHVALACARALQHAHNLELVHRDIKPDNILLTRSGQVKVADLGMVKVLDEENDLTQTGHGVGTPCYMPLEQAKNGKDADGRSDIYALGCLLYAALTGEPPFRGATIVELIQAKEMGTFKPARRFNRDVPERLDLILHKMMAKNPRDRYQTCAELIRDLSSLGMDAPELTFLHPDGSRPSTQTTALRSSSPTELASQTPMPDTPTGDVWQVRYRDRHGETVTRRLTTAEVLDLIADEDFDLKAQGSSPSGSGFRSLASFREFRQVLLPRVTRAGADRKSKRLKALYQKFDEEDTPRPYPPQDAEPSVDPRQWFRLPDLPTSIPPEWHFPLLAGAAIGLSIIVLYALLRLVIAWVFGPA
jgi:eukaryotic-like serine/threonine-protein kinase